MDAQKNLILPKLDTKNYVFKLKLNLHNNTIMNMETGEVMCYLFSDVDCDLTASTFISTLVDFIRKQNELYPGIDIDIESDTCAAACRNRYIANALAFLAVELQVNITQFFFISGHSFMSVDTVHSLIERRIKSKEITSVEMYIDEIKKARIKQPLQVKMIDHNFVKDYTTPLIVKSIRPGQDLVKDIKAIKYTKTGSMETLTSYIENTWKQIKGPKINNLAEERSLLRDGPIPLTANKFKDLISMLPVVPEQHQEFYRKLPHV